MPPLVKHLPSVAAIKLTWALLLYYLNQFLCILNTTGVLFFFKATMKTLLFNSNGYEAKNKTFAFQIQL